MEDFGFTYISMDYLQETVEIIIKSKKGEELKKKPLLIYIQGSLAKPLIRYSDNGRFKPPYSFDARIFLDHFHIVSIKKPGLPLIANSKDLTDRGEYVNKKTRNRPQKFNHNNYLDYYVERNKKVIQFLLTNSWVDSSKIVVAGHSQGSSIALGMADKIPEITHLIYSAGGPYFGTIVDQIQQERKQEKNETDSFAQEVLNYWKTVVNDPLNTDSNEGNDTHRMWHSFSTSENEIFKRLKIPVLVCYGTKDTAAPFNDLLQIETILNGINNIRFYAYIGREHNYFKVKENGDLDFSEKEFGWDKVGNDWFQWIMKN